MENTKCVMIIDGELPLGIISNTAAILGITLGKHIPQRIGQNIVDATGSSHLGIIDVPVPILKGNSSMLKELREKLYQSEYSDLIVADFSDVAQRCNKYEDYIENSSKTEEKNFKYFGIAICGTKKKINHLTGSIPLLR